MILRMSLKKTKSEAEWAWVNKDVDIWVCTFIESLTF